MVFHEINCFIELAECLNYSVAASNLYISQSSLSKVIASLETEMGIKLFNRSTRKVELTEAGREFYLSSKSFFSNCERIKSSGRTIQTKRGRLSIGVSNMVDTSFLVFMMEAFKSNYPNISLNMTTHKNETLHRQLKSKKIDIAVAPSFGTCEPDEDQAALFPYSLSILTSNQRKTKRKLTLEDICKERIVLMDAGTSKSTQIMLNMITAAGLKVRDSVYAANFRQMYMLTAQGEGISFNVTSSNAWEYWNLQRVPVELHVGLLEGSFVGVAMKWIKENPNTDIVLSFAEFMQRMKCFIPAYQELSDD